MKPRLTPRPNALGRLGLLALALAACGGPPDPAFVSDVARRAPPDPSNLPAGERAVIVDAQHDLDAARVEARAGREDLAMLFADRANARLELASAIHNHAATVVRVAAREAEVLPVEADARARERERADLAAQVKSLEARLEVVDRALAPTASRTAPDAREEARRAAASAALDRARFFCAAAKLLGHPVAAELDARLGRAEHGAAPAAAPTAANAPASAAARSIDEAIALRAECLFALNHGAPTSEAEPARTGADAHARAARDEAIRSGFTATLDEAGARVELTAKTVTPAQLEAIAHVASASDARVVFEVSRASSALLPGYTKALTDAGFPAARVGAIVATHRAPGTVGVAFVVAR